jgi:SsrA-binding protein
MTLDSGKILASNRKARHEYFIDDTLEAGIALLGTEIKSLRLGRASLQEAYVAVTEGEMWLLHMHIPPYTHGSNQNHEPLRPRKLLLHRSEIRRWAARVQQKGFTIVPLKIYLKGGRAKIEIGLARGKKLYDKRQILAEKDSERRIDRALSEHQRNR